MDDDLRQTASPAAVHDDRFGLLLDLRYLASAFLEEVVARNGDRVLSPAISGEMADRAVAVRASLDRLARLGDCLGLTAVLPPRIDLAAGFAAIARQAGVAVFDPLATGTELLTSALLVNSLGYPVIAALLCEGDTAAWRRELLPVFADDCRFEGYLKAALVSHDPGAACRASELLTLSCGSLSAGERLWGFDLLRMAISQFVCGGNRDRKGGFFPDGMSGG
ncbi:hypothetical protein [Luteolibacter marinus]|uniref:hypothetical protein n=1 Tax=Luteolibacter marinus TaxID=2776705 RepID=UPI0018675769|nr:hypothetical protein [Luteolibacter marinus]